MLLDAPFRLGPFIVDADGRLCPSTPERFPSFCVAWRGQVARARLTATGPDGGTLALQTVLGRVPSTGRPEGAGALPRRAAFAAMRDGAHLVNVARGSIVDQEALIDALDNGHVRMATLDVAEPEPLPAGHVLYTHPKVRLSAHVSWSAPGTLQMTLQLFAENVRRYASGERLAGVVNAALGY